MKRRRVRLVPNWRRVLIRAWSIWAMLFSFLLLAAAETLPLMADYLPVSPLTIALISLALGVFARLIEQPKLSGE